MKVHYGKHRGKVPKIQNWVRTTSNLSKLALFYQKRLFLRGFLTPGHLKLDGQAQEPWIWILWVLPDPSNFVNVKYSILQAEYSGV